MDQEKIDKERNAVVAEAMLWVDTPYHHAATIRGVGCDCISLVACVFQNTGMTEKFTLPKYSPQWNMHREQELCLIGLSEYADEVLGPPERDPLPGDLVVFRYARAFSHNAIVIKWPTIIHCWQHGGVKVGNVDRDLFLKVHGREIHDKTLIGTPRPRKFFCLKRWHVA